MKKIFLITCLMMFSINLSAEYNITADGFFYKLTKKATKENYPIKKHHEVLDFDCKTCHGEPIGDNYGIVTTQKCLQCHKSYDALAKRSGHLGYDDNIHASPHYPDMDCNICHSSHKKSTNYCAMCHSQDSMKNLLVP